MANRCYRCKTVLIVPSDIDGLVTITCQKCGSVNKFGSFVRKMVKEPKDHD